MNPRRLATLSLACVMLVLMSVPTPAETTDNVPVYAVSTGPGAQFYGYAAPAVVTEKGGSVTYINLDIARHDLVQDVEADGFAGSQKKPWCKSYKKGTCPIFWTPTIGIGQTTEVQGLDSVKAGETYSFLCTLHPGMKGTLVVRP